MSGEWRPPQVKIIPLRSRGRPGLFGILSRYNEAHNEIFRSIPGIWFDRDFTRKWVGYPDAMAQLVLVLRSQGIEVDDSTLPAFTSPENLTGPYLNIAEKGLRPYQVTGVKFLLERGLEGAILADGMGLGKSAQALRAIRTLPAKTVIICPNSVRGVWPHQIRQWYSKKCPIAMLDGIGVGATVGKRGAGLATEFSLKGKGFKADPTLIARRSNVRMHPTWPECQTALTDDVDLAIISHDIVHAWVDVLIAWGVKYLIIDEGHVIQGGKSLRAEALSILVEHCVWKVILTGTPIVGLAKTFYQTANLISPNRFGPTFFAYGLMFCAGHQEEVIVHGGTPKVVWKWDGSSNLDVLRERAKWFVLRRTKKEVGLQLPPRTRQIIEIEVPVRARIMPGLDTIKKSKEMRRHLDLSADAKIKSLIEDLYQRTIADWNGTIDPASGAHQVVCFTWRKRVAEILVDEFMRRKVAATFIHGGTSTSRRVRRIREGQKAAREGRPHLLAATLATTSTGIDLTYADVGAFAELTHVPHFFAQAEKRLDRHGQTRMVSFYYYIAKSTGDELILAHVINKLDVEDSVLGENDEGLKDALDKDPKGQAALDELYESVLKTMKRKNT